MRFITCRRVKLGFANSCTKNVTGQRCAEHLCVAEICTCELAAVSEYRVRQICVTEIGGCQGSVKRRRRQVLTRKIKSATSVQRYAGQVVRLMASRRDQLGRRDIAN